MRVEVTEWRSMIKETILSMRWSFFIVGLAIAIAVILYQLLGLIPLSLYVASGLINLIISLSIFTIAEVMMRALIDLLIERVRRRRF